MKRINAKLVEIYKRYHELALFEKVENKILKIIEFRYKIQSMCVFPIEGNEKFILTAVSGHPNRILKDMVKFRMHLFELRTEREDYS